MKAKIIAIANQKGGVAKTTSVAAIGSIMASKGYKTLLVDLDTQGNLTDTFLQEEPDETLYGALKGKHGLPQIEVRDGLYIVASGGALLGSIETELARTAENDYILRDLLQAVAPRYSYILLDCPPSLSLITRSAFAAASSVLIPVTAEALPTRGLQKVEALIDDLRRSKKNAALSLAGIFFTRWEISRLSKMIEERLREAYKDKVLSTKIRKNIAIAEAPCMLMDVTEYAPDSNGAKDYMALTEELLQVLKK